MLQSIVKSPVNRLGNLRFLVVLVAVFVMAGCSGGPKKRISDARAVVNGAAVSQIGAPYKFRGDDRTGFGSAGLVAFAYREAGYDIPSYAEGQLRAGQPIEFADATKGDILFYRLRQIALGGEPLLHSGIYLGNGKMAHASADRDEVVVDDVGTSYWADRLVAVIRILP